MRRNALREDPTLDNLIAAARAMEMADRQAKNRLVLFLNHVSTKLVKEEKLKQRKTLTNLLKVQRKLVLVVVVHGHTQQDILVQLSE